MKKLRVMLGDLSYKNKYNGWMQVVPINIGYIGQYINQMFSNDIHVSLHKDPYELLEVAKYDKPDIVGLSLYYWNTDLNRAVAKQLKNSCGQDVTIVHGGPSTDTEDHEQIKYLNKDSGVDCLILEEGEVPFSEIVKKKLSNEDVFSNPIDGIVYLQDHELVRGDKKTVQTDLNNLYSPYLSGILNKFVDSDHLPIIQMSRYCPYTCSYCVSGKTRGKLREFPIEMVKEEINLISKKIF